MERFKREKKCRHCDNNGCFTLDNLKFSTGITEIKSKEDTIEKS